MNFLRGLGGIPGGVRFSAWAWPPTIPPPTRGPMSTLDPLKSRFWLKFVLIVKKVNIKKLLWRNGLFRESRGTPGRGTENGDPGEAQETVGISNARQFSNALQKVKWETYKIFIKEAFKKIISF